MVCLSQYDQIMTQSMAWYTILLCWVWSKQSSGCTFLCSLPPQTAPPRSCSGSSVLGWWSGPPACSNRGVHTSSIRPSYPPSSNSSGHQQPPGLSKSLQHYALPHQATSSATISPLYTLAIISSPHPDPATTNPTCSHMQCSALNSQLSKSPHVSIGFLMMATWQSSW